MESSSINRQPPAVPAVTIFSSDSQECSSMNKQNLEASDAVSVEGAHGAGLGSER